MAKVVRVVGDEDESFRQRVGGNLGIHATDGSSLSAQCGGDSTVAVGCASVPVEHRHFVQEGVDQVVPLVSVGGQEGLT